MDFAGWFPSIMRFRLSLGSSPIGKSIIPWESMSVPTTHAK